MNSVTRHPNLAHSSSVRGGRPRFSLSDDQARVLAAAVNAAAEQFPLDPANHRPFVRAFLRAVLDATGKTYSPAIYRRLLGAYAPGRCPSTTTLALEKEVLEQELAVGAAVAGALAPQDDAGVPVADVLRRVLREQLPAPGRAAAPDHDGQFKLLLQRMGELEREREEARAHAASLAAQLREVQSLLEAAQQREQDARVALAAQQAGYARLADELADMRRFSMQAVDAVRGETREVRERCAYLEGVLRKKEGEVDMYRQLALGGKR